MTRKTSFMKQLAPWLAVLGLLSSSASAATLTLTDWTTLPFPSDANHADTYPLPFTPSVANPIVQIEMDYKNMPIVTGAGIHEIKSAAFLFAAGDLATTTVLESTVDRYWVRILFRTAPADRRLGALTNPQAPAFVAFHGPTFGSALTSAIWTVTYLDGNTATFNNGIIPEPGTAAWIGLSGTLILFVRRRNRADAAA